MEKMLYPREIFKILFPIREGKTSKFRGVGFPLINKLLWAIRWRVKTVKYGFYLVFSLR
jgi:hypothetical protein